MSLLSPEQRTIYGDMLSPPVGYQFDCGFGTTFSLSLTTLLSAPLRMTLNGIDESERLLENRIALLEALQRTAKRMTLFCQKGFISGERISPLSSLLEPVVQEVSLPDGVLHAKIWLLRYAETGKDRGRDRALLRLVIPSRNVTLDRCWDTALVLDGVPTGGGKRRNAPLVRLISWLREQAQHLDVDRRSQLDLLGQEVASADWELPEEFDELEFAVTGLGKKLKDWPLLPGAQRIAVISPFIRKEALHLVASQSPKAELTLVSRIDQLQSLSPPANSHWQPYVLHQGLFEELDDAATAEADKVANSDLHAKIYLADYAAGRGGNLAVVVGSANATNAALVRQSNIEILARLTGRHRLTGTVADLLGPECMGKYLRPFQWPEAPAEADPSNGDLVLETARRTIADVHWHLIYEKHDADEWRPLLTADRQISLPVNVTGSVRLATAPENRTSLLACESKITPLATCATADATRFLSITISFDDRKSISWILNLPDVILPDGRDNAVIRSVISNSNAFLAYLRFLLGDLDGIEALDGLLRHGQESTGQQQTALYVMPLLEDLIRALVHAPDRLSLIQRLMDQVRSNSELHNVVPDGFMELWEALAPMAAGSESA